MQVTADAVSGVGISWPTVLLVLTLRPGFTAIICCCMTVGVLLLDGGGAVDHLVACGAVGSDVSVVVFSSSRPRTGTEWPRQT